jgi:hypothetical protein
MPQGADAAGTRKREYPVERGDIRKLSKFELVSIYINLSFKMDAPLRESYEDELRGRKLEIPREVCAEGKSPARKEAIDKETFLSYILLIYTITGVFYSWIYIIERIIKRDFYKNTKHKLIMSLISFIYIFLEVIAAEIFIFE